MSTIIVLIMTTAQAIAIAFGYFAPLPALFEAFVVYGSPIYIIFNIIGGSSIVNESTLLFPLIATFHVIKYAMLGHSQFSTERYGLHYLAAVLEIAYISFCAYYF